VPQWKKHKDSGKAPNSRTYIILGTKSIDSGFTPGFCSVPFMFKSKAHEGKIHKTTPTELILTAAEEVLHGVNAFNVLPQNIFEQVLSAKIVYNIVQSPCGHVVKFNM